MMRREIAQNDANEILCITFASYFASSVFGFIFLINSLLFIGMMQSGKLFDQKTFLERKETILFVIELLVLF